MATSDDPAGSFVVDQLFGDLIDAFYALLALALVVGICWLPFHLVRMLKGRRGALIGLLAGALLMTAIHLATAPLKYTWGLGWRRAVGDRVLVDRSLQQSGLGAYVKTTYEGPDEGDKITWLHPVTRLDRWVDQKLYQRMIADAVPPIDSKDELAGLLAIVGLITGVVGIVIKALVWIIAWTPLIKILSAVSVWPFVALAAGQGLRGAEVKFPAFPLVIVTAGLGLFTVVTAPDDTRGPPIDEPVQHQPAVLEQPPPPSEPPRPPEPPPPPPSACGDPSFDPGVERWSEHACRDPRPGETGCLARSDYTAEPGRGCPGLQLCCLGN